VAPIPAPPSFDASVTGIDAREKIALEVGETVWHDRNYTFTGIPEPMRGGGFFQQAHESNGAGTEIVVSVSTPATIFVALEDGSRDGGLSSSLPLAGWAEVQAAVLLTTGTELSRVFRLDPGAGSIALPATTTANLVMSIVAVERLAGAQASAEHLSTVTYHRNGLPDCDAACDTDARCTHYTACPGDGMKCYLKAGAPSESMPASASAPSAGNGTEARRRCRTHVPVRFVTVPPACVSVLSSCLPLVPRSLPHFVFLAPRFLLPCFLCGDLVSLLSDISRLSSLRSHVSPL
jgi:hypothetical protein